MKRHPISQIPLLPVTLAALLLLGLLPVRFLRWTPLLADPLDAVLAPFTHAGSFVAAYLRPARRASVVVDENVAALREEADRYYRLWLQAEHRIDTLTVEVAELRNARALTPETSDIFLTAPIIRSASDLNADTMKIKGGRNRGITAGVVAVYRGVHLVGRVDRVGPVTSTLLPVTSRGAGYLDCAIMPPDREATMAEGARCQLRPHGSDPNLLTGDVEGTADWIKAADAETLLVRLNDTHWPDGAQALIVGRIVRAYHDDANPLRLRVDVRPTYYPLASLPQVTLRLPGSAEAPSDDREENG